jgi:ethanolamine transporter EutH
VRHHLAYRLRQYAALCDRAPLAAGLLVGGLVAIVVNIDLAPKARLARWVARRIER